MKLKSVVLTFVFSGLLLAQTTVQFKWPAVQKFTGKSSSSLQFFELADWEMRTPKGQSQSIHLPFLISETPFLTLAKNVQLPSPLPTGATIYLMAQGIWGSTYFYVNEHLVGVSANASNPLRLQIPEDYWKADSVLNLVLKIRQPQSADQGFPTIVYNFSEKQFIGPGAMIYLVVEKKPHLNLLDLTLQRSENGFVLHYQYEILDAQPMQSIKINERIVRSSDGKIFLKKQRFSRQFNRKNIVLKGTVPLPANALWSPENPQILQLTLEAEVSYEKGKTTLQLTQDFGARTIEQNRKKFFINGQPTIVKGMVYHFSPTIFSEQSYYAQLKQFLSFVRAQGFNALRLNHFLPDEVVLHLADSLGLMIFAEFPIWRFPAEFFNENFLLEAAKNIATQIRPFYLRHPSLVAIGLGQEIPLHAPITQKFMFILNGKLKSQLPVLTYLSPIPGFPLPPEHVADFYLYDRYQPVHFLNLVPHLRAFALLGKIGLLPAEMLTNEGSDETQQLNRSLFIKNEIYKTLNDLQPNGGFVECLYDWFTQYPNNFSIVQPALNLVPLGFLTSTGQPKAWTKLLANPWELTDTGLIDQFSDHKPRTNFFSILMTFSTILFFAIYRRVPRLRENFRRSLRHSYGFFVDLRERRIIPFFNSITISMFISLVAAVFLASQIYYYHHSLWLQEILAVILVPLGIFKYFLQLSQNKIIITALLFTAFVFIPVLGAVLLKILAWINRSKIRFRQGFATIAWAGAPLAWFFPVSLVTYHWLFLQQPSQWLWIIFALFVLWTQIRIVNGLHILFIAKTSKVFTILLLCYFVPILIFWALFNPPGYWVDYLQLLVKAQSLF